MDGKSLLIVFEGIDGTGKSTQLTKAREHVLSTGREVVMSKDPGGTKLGLAIRRIMYEEVPTHELAVGVVDLLFLASHLQNWKTVVRPALGSGKVVISDRWWYSQEAYSTVRYVPPDIRTVYEATHGGPADLIIFLYTSDVKLVVDRARSRETETHQSAKAWNDYDQLSRVQDAYCALYSGHRGWWPVCIDGKGPVEVFVEVSSAIDSVLCRREHVL